MPIERNIPVRVEAEEVMSRLQTGRRRRKKAPDFSRLAEDVCSCLPDLLQTGVAWTVVRKVGINEDGVVHVSDPQSGRAGNLTVGERSHFLDPARDIVLAVKTIGVALEERVRCLEADNPLKAYVLDVAGVIALDKVSDWFRIQVQGMAREKGWGVSPSLLPGSLSGWSVEGQKELCRFLDLELLDISLNAFSVLKPHKSDSVTIGMGPGYSESVVASLCGDCPRKETCPWRH